MKLRDKQVILESLQEVSEVFWGPVGWDGRAGGSQCAFFAAYSVLNLSEEFSKDCCLGFSKPELEEYWDKLSVADENYKAHFDFDVGLEDKYSSKHRDEDDPILLAARHIYSVGIDKFDFTYVNGESHQSVRATNKDTDKSFDFIDVEDPAMYFSFRELAENQINAAAYNEIQKRLSVFIS